MGSDSCLALHGLKKKKKREKAIGAIYLWFSSVQGGVCVVCGKAHKLHRVSHTFPPHL